MPVVGLWKESVKKNGLSPKIRKRVLILNYFFIILKKKLSIELKSNQNRLTVTLISSATVLTNELLVDKPNLEMQKQLRHSQIHLIID